MSIPLSELNRMPLDQAVQAMHGLYEHSDWIAQRALAQRPFASAAHFKQAMVQVLRESTRDMQLALICAHPELAGKAMLGNNLTAASTDEQSRAGLTNCSAQELAQIQQLNSDYNTKFGFPFILAVRGPRGVGLTRQQILATWVRRLNNPADFEFAEALRNIHRIAEIRLNDKLGISPTLGQEVWDWHEWLAQFSDPGFAEHGELTVTYLTPAHLACARTLTLGMQACGFDEVHTDAVGNVVGIYHGTQPQAPRLLTGSHYDTVRNGGKYDGRLGILVPMACVRELARQGRRLANGIEVVAFAEEEGQRYRATFLGSGALVGQFNTDWLNQADADGVTMRAAMAQAGLDPKGIGSLRRDPSRYLGFVEVHIEQGPVLNEQDLPLGVVSSINGSERYLCEIHGMASHAGTTPMDRRRDAAVAMAELALFMERRAARDGDSVATIGQLGVPNGSINVVPGRCQFSLDMRAPIDAQRDALVTDVLAELDAICHRRGVRHHTEKTLSVAAAPSHPQWQARWAHAVAASGLPVHHLPSGAGHDAMKLHEIMPQAMLFVRGENSGISHNPLESVNCDDLQLAIDAFAHLLDHLHETPTP